MKKNKKLFVILSVALIVLATGVIIFLVANKKDNKKDKNVECENITGGSYNLLFDADGGDKIESINVCIACPPNSYAEIPKPKKDGFVFVGWYLDKELKNEVVVTNTMDLEVIPKKDKNDCVIGYEDITLYAKWSKEEVKTLKVTFDSNGGNKVNNLEFKCDKSNSAILSNLPVSSKDGYKFVAWQDSHGTSILSGAKITCSGDLKLTAKWEQKK